MEETTNLYKRVLVCGGRGFTDTEFIYSTLDKLLKEHPIEVVIEGNALGADRIAGFWARKNGLINLKFPADWDKYKKAAGFIRNREMLDKGLPDLVVAFPGGRGTQNMIKLAKKSIRGIAVWEVEYQ